MLLIGIERPDVAGPALEEVAAVGRPPDARPRSGAPGTPGGAAAGRARARAEPDAGGVVGPGPRCQPRGLLRQGAEPVRPPIGSRSGCTIAGRARWISVASSDAGEIAARRRVAADDPAVPVSLAMRTRRRRGSRRARCRDADDARAAAWPAPRARHARGRGACEWSRGRKLDILARLDEAATLSRRSSRACCCSTTLLRARRELENTFNSLADLVVVSDGRLRVSHANQAFAARFGRRAAELIDHPLAELLRARSGGLGGTARDAATGWKRERVGIA